MIYRLLIDEDGQEDCRDFSKLEDAHDEFVKAQKRKTVFSARVDSYDENLRKHVKKIHEFARVT